MSITNENNTSTINKAFHTMHLFPIGLEKDTIKTKYTFIKNAINAEKFGQINMNSIPSIFETYKDKQTKTKMSDETKEKYEDTLSNDISNYFVSGEWLHVSQLTKKFDLNVNSWKEVHAINGDSFYVCFVYLLFTKVIICNSKKFKAITFDIIENFAREIEFFKEKFEVQIDFTETHFVLKSIDNQKGNYPITTFNNYFNKCESFVRSMILYIRYCLYRCIKDSPEVLMSEIEGRRQPLIENWMFVFEEGTEPFPREVVFEMLCKLFAVNLKVKEFATETNKEILIHKGSSNIDFYILHFGGRYHLYSDLNEKNDGVLIKKLSLKDKNINIEKDCACSFKEYFMYISLDNVSLVCVKCLKKRIFDIMTKRVEMYLESQYKHNKEMYLSPIYVNEQTAFRDVVLSNVFDIQDKYQSYLSEVFETMINNCCCVCHKVISNREDKVELNCKCVNHINCSKQQLSMNVNDFFLKTCYNDCDSVLVQFKCVNCKKESSLNTTLDRLLTEEQKEKAKKQFISYCMNCGISISSKVKTEFNNNKCIDVDKNGYHYKCKIVQEDNSLHNKLFPFHYHFLCFNCIQDNEVSKCAFCNQRHFVNKETLIKEHLKNY